MTLEQLKLPARRIHVHGDWSASGPARPEAARLHEAVQGRPRHARELRDGGLGDAQLEEAPDVVLSAVEARDAQEPFGRPSFRPEARARARPSRVRSGPLRGAQG